MTILKLLVKAATASQLKQIEDRLKVEFGNLDIELQVSIVQPSRWVQVTLGGEDEAVATSYINQNFGICPANIKNIVLPTDLRGYITKVDMANQELKVDVGIFEPQAAYATVPLAVLQSQLVGGKKLALQKISELFAFHENLPLTVKMPAIGEEGLMAELATPQVERFRSWVDSLLDRLIVLGAPRSQVEAVLERARLNRDVIDVDALGMFEHALTCKLGTDAAGIMPRIGAYLKNSVFLVFNPRKIVTFAGGEGLTL